jgi:hypothetical protein
MSLEAKEWTPASLHKVVLAWLRAERAILVQRANWSADKAELFDEPDIFNADQNRERLHLLYEYRWPLLAEVPPDTKWFEVRLTDAEIPELHAINHQEWTNPGDKNELAKVAARKRLPLTSEPSSWESPVLWGHDRRGPFTILEGNHRLTAYVRSGQSCLDIPVLVGLSPAKCKWHLLDEVGVLLQDD